jgi:hypothetical protein
LQTRPGPETRRDGSEAPPRDLSKAASTIWQDLFKNFKTACKFVRQFRGNMGSDGFEKVLIGTLGPRETFLRGIKKVEMEKSESE